MNIPFAKPYIINDKEIEAVSMVIKSGWLTHGPKTIEFEKKFANYIGTKYAIAVNSCTSALFLSLKTIGVKNGDEVITTPFTFAATANTIVHCGARPVFVDIKKDTFNIDPNKIEEKITKKTKAIVAVHYAGQPADVTKIKKIADKYNLKIVEDAAHAVGSVYDTGEKVGAVNNLACFSFYVTKPITTGEGGMITTNDEKLCKKLKILRMHGIDRDAWNRYNNKGSWYYKIIEAGYKCNTTDLNSAIGLKQLEKIDWMNKKRKELAEFYDKSLKKIPQVELYKIKDNIKSSYHLYPILLKGIDRNEFLNKMKKSGITCSVHFIPLQLMPFYQRKFHYKKGDFPVCESVYEKIVSLPIYPALTKQNIKYIVDAIEKILRC